MTIFYTTVEGGVFHRLDTQLEKREILMFLNQNLDEEIKRSGFYKLQIEGGEFIIVHSIIFNDGDMWDASKSGFRKAPGTFGTHIYTQLMENIKRSHAC